MLNLFFVNAEWCKYDAVSVTWFIDWEVVTFVWSFVCSILLAFITKTLSNKYNKKKGLNTSEFKFNTRDFVTFLLALQGSQITFSLIARFYL